MIFKLTLYTKFVISEYINYIRRVPHGILNLLIPVMMIGIGNYFSKNAPKQINFIWGYRKTRSMKNQKTWQFAHHYIGQLWVKIGWLLVFISILPMFFCH